MRKLIASLALLLGGILPSYAQSFSSWVHTQLKAEAIIPFVTADSKGEGPWPGTAMLKRSASRISNTLFWQSHNQRWCGPPRTSVGAPQAAGSSGPTILRFNATEFRGFRDEAKHLFGLSDQDLAELVSYEIVVSNRKSITLSTPTRMKLQREFNGCLQNEAAKYVVQTFLADVTITLTSRSNLEASAAHILAARFPNSRSVIFAVGGTRAMIALDQFVIAVETVEN